MKENYSIFRRFSTLEQARELEFQLNRNGIDTVLADNVPPVDITFSGNTLQNEIEIRINPADFEKAEQILKQNAENVIDQVDKDHYLFAFTDEELYEILLKPDEWNEFDHALAKKVLEQRGRSVDEKLLHSLQNQRLKQLAKPEENQHPWIIGGYIFAFLGGLIGLIIGYILWTSKKTLPNGQKVYSYMEKDRKHGKIIFFIGVVIFPLGLILRLWGGLYL